jgi:hypothetical protein
VPGSLKHIRGKKVPSFIKEKVASSSAYFGLTNPAPEMFDVCGLRQHFYSQGDVKKGI